MRLSAALLVFLFAFSTSAPAQTRASGGDLGAQALALINAYRTRTGLSPLVPNATLQALARQHSQYQARRGRLSHDGYRQRSASAKAAGLTARCAENAGRNYRTAQQLFAGWRRSSAHNRNLLRPNLKYAGLSIVGDYSTFFACG